jgi:protein-disulfide isomerase
VSTWPRFLPKLAVALVSAALAAGAASVVIPQSATTPKARTAAESVTLTPDQRTELERWYGSLPRLTLPVPSDGAAVLIVKFTDLQCPGCAATYFGYAPIISKYQSRFPGALRVVTKDYPLQPECNPLVSRPLHTAACDAAVAVRLAARHNKGAALEEWFYANQSLMSPVAVRDAAARIGSVRDFDSSDAAATAGIGADVSLASSLHVSSTPTFFVNGVRLPNSPSLPPPEQFDAIIAYELKKAGVPTGGDGVRR